MGPDPHVASSGDSRGAGSELALMQFLINRGTLGGADFPILQRRRLRWGQQDTALQAESGSAWMSLRRSWRTAGTSSGSRAGGKRGSHLAAGAGSGSGDWLLMTTLRCLCCDWRESRD